eukprot:12911450-Prorocentrum_lima.AAC.2
MRVLPVSTSASRTECGEKTMDEPPGVWDSIVRLDEGGVTAAGGPSAHACAGGALRLAAAECEVRARFRLRPSIDPGDTASGGFAADETSPRSAITALPAPLPAPTGLCAP